MPATPKKLSGTSQRRSWPATPPATEAEDASGSDDRRQAHGQPTAGIGERLRLRRTEAGLSLRRLARDLDLSASFLSQVETGKAQPSVTTLYLICSALDLSIDELFAGAGRPGSPVPEAAEPDPRASGEPVPVARAGRAASPPPVVTRAARRRLVLDSGVVWEQLQAVHGGAIDFMFVRYDVGGSSTLDERLTRHSGIEYGYVMRGTLEVTLGFQTYRVGPGDAISFDSATPHRLGNIGDEPVEAVWFVHGRND